MDHNEVPSEFQRTPHLGHRLSDLAQSLIAYPNKKFWENQELGVEPGWLVDRRTPRCQCNWLYQDDSMTASIIGIKTLDDLLWSMLEHIFDCI